jgi:serine/threonine protein kinase
VNSRQNSILNGVPPSDRRSGNPAVDDPRVIAALEEYAAALEAGAAPDREAFLARHAEVAEALAGCLTGLDFVHELGPGLRPEGPGEAPDAPAPAAVAPPGVLGDFRIVREVGRGGMGVVYEAEQLSLGRRVALKVLPFGGMLDPRHLQRFQNEARAAACLHHTNIVPVFAVGSDRGVHYYAMQFIEGQSLAALVHQLRQPGPADPARAPVPLDEQTTAYQPGDGAAATEPVARELTLGTGGSARGREYFRRVAELGVQAAEALDHAHQVGIVHRDVKPANLMVDARGNLWVTDFGLAHIQHGEASLTATGDLVGTLRYMSPEAERQEWQKLWADVTDTRARAERKTAP